MKFVNRKVRIGPPSVERDRFIVERNGRQVKGKRHEIPKFLADIGLNLYEYNAGRGFKFKKRKDLAPFRENSKKHDILITVHGPYYISLCSDSSDTLERSIDRIGELYQGALWLGAKRAVFHVGGYGKKRTKEECLKTAISSIKEGLRRLPEKYPKEYKEFENIALCPETAGKHGSLGDLTEIITICKEIGTDTLIPTIDFGHMYAYSVGKKTKKQHFLKIFEKIEKELGKKVAENLHIHYSKVEYTKAGEKMHHINSDVKWGPEFEPIIDIIIELGYTPTIVNESPDLEEDARRLMEIYRKRANK